ncbi:putative transcriptional regulator YdeE [Bradyrhizobium sp. USDA 4354]
MTCLEMINQALTEVKKESSMRFCGFDNEGHCRIAPHTQESIATLWQTMMERQQAAQERGQVAPAA